MFLKHSIAEHWSITRMNKIWVRRFRPYNWNFMFFIFLTYFASYRKLHKVMSGIRASPLISSSISWKGWWIGYRFFLYRLKVAENYGLRPIHIASSFSLPLLLWLYVCLKAYIKINSHASTSFVTRRFPFNALFSERRIISSFFAPDYKLLLLIRDEHI